MDLPTVLSVVALVVSIGSVAVTVWATGISKRSHEHAINVQERSDQKEFERLRSELLNQISDSRSANEKSRIEIGTLQANFRAECPAVQALMVNYVVLFTEFLPKVEQATHQCDELWNHVSSWTNEKSHAELMQARATLYRSLKDDEVVQQSVAYTVSVFNTKLELAKQQLLLSRSEAPAVDKAERQ
jgi:hypothetical protein